MQTCSNCGATLRPGARFCTTCGTRLNETPTADNDGWGTPRADSQDNAQETSVMQSVQPQDTDSWSGSNSGSSSASDDPASRFISALDQEVPPAKDDEGDSAAGAESAWDTPPPVFTPPPPSNWSYSADAVDAKSEDDTAAESTWEAPSTWSTGEVDEGAPDEPAAVDAKVIAPEDDQASALPPDELRDRAIELADELRRTVRLMSSGGEHDHGAAVMALTEASLYVSDFSDVRGSLAEVRNDPRNIEALTNLAGKIDRIEALLDEHKSLVDAIETAIKELNG